MPEDANSSGVHMSSIKFLSTAVSLGGCFQMPACLLGGSVDTLTYSSKHQRIQLRQEIGKICKLNLISLNPRRIIIFEFEHFQLR